MNDTHSFQHLAVPCSSVRGAGEDVHVSVIKSSHTKYAMCRRSLYPNM